MVGMRGWRKAAVVATFLGPSLVCLLAFSLGDISSWVSGTVAGYLAGDFLPADIQSSISICLYAMFVAILVPAVKNSARAGVVAVIAGAVNSLLYYSGILGSGWSIVVSILVASSAGMILFRSEV